MAANQFFPDGRCRSSTKACSSTKTCKGALDSHADARSVCGPVSQQLSAISRMPIRFLRRWESPRVSFSIPCGRIPVKKGRMPFFFGLYVISVQARPFIILEKAGIYDGGFLKTVFFAILKRTRRDWIALSFCGAGGVPRAAEPIYRPGDLRRPGGDGSCEKHRPLPGTLIPGARVYVQRHRNPARKTALSLIAVEKDGRLVNIDSQAPNAVWQEALARRPASPGKAGSGRANPPGGGFRRFPPGFLYRMARSPGVDGG